MCNVRLLVAAGLLVSATGCMENGYPTTGYGGYPSGYGYPSSSYYGSNYGYSSGYYSQPTYYQPVQTRYVPVPVTQTRYVPVPTSSSQPSWSRRDDDGDGIPNRYDRDRNNDGIPDRRQRRSQ